MTTENNFTNAQIADIDWEKVRGTVRYRLTNDYMFRAVLQTNHFVLKSLIASLLHMDISEISTCVIENPIELGKSIDEKSFFLDIKVLLNNHIIINLELQIENEHNWTDRSLIYLCRSFDNLNKGKDYKEIKPAIHISLLDFDLFQKSDEFYATYYMLNEKTYQKYSDKFRLSVLNLRKADNATRDDQLHGLDRWARLFKAKTWEELHMLSKTDPAFEEAVATMYRLSKDKQIQMQCEAREEYYRRKRTTEALMKEKDAEISEKNAQISQKDAQISQLKKLLSQHGILPDEGNKTV